MIRSAIGWRAGPPPSASNDDDALIAVIQPSLAHRRARPTADLCGGVWSAYTAPKGNTVQLSEYETICCRARAQTYAACCGSISYLNGIAPKGDPSRGSLRSWHAEPYGALVAGSSRVRREPEKAHMPCCATLTSSAEGARVLPENARLGRHVRGTDMQHIDRRSTLSKKTPSATSPQQSPRS